MKVKFFTLGCKVNQYESQALMEQFAKGGWEVTEGVADLCVVNTCTVTHQADAKSRQSILKAKNENPRAQIVACGCYAQINKERLEKLGVDYIVGQDRKHLLFDIVQGSTRKESDVWNLTINGFFNTRAFLKVQDGCNNRCSFCKIPYVRGASRSRCKKDVIGEIQRLSKHYREIVLCGINLGLYGRDFSPRQDLAGLIREILEIESLGRLRLSSLEPSLISDELLSLLKHPKLCPHLHLPFQSGDDWILRQMNKNETAAHYCAIVQKARTIRPECAISCDIMVGFPLEEDAHFKNTVIFLKKIKPMRMHIFRFSPREKTQFENIRLRNQEKIKERSDILKQLAKDFSLEYRKQFLAKPLTVIAQSSSGTHTKGVSDNYISVECKGTASFGKMHEVIVVKVENDKTYAVFAAGSNDAS